MKKITSKYIAGDVVSLLGTKMRMTVVASLGRSVHCVWFDRNNQENDFVFSEDDLEKISL